MKKTFFTVAVLGTGLMTAQLATADSITGTIGGAPTGASLVNFDNLTLTANSLPTPQTATGLSGQVDVAFSPDAGAVKGSLSGVYAAPDLSSANGTGFGDSVSSPNQAIGIDATTFLTSGIDSGATMGKVTLSNFGGSNLSLKYLGLLWGSVDTYNTLTLYSGGVDGTVVETITGAEVIANANGDQGPDGTVYVNIDTDIAFDTVVMTSSQYAFEFDNVAYSEEPLTVPDGGLTVAMLGLAFAGVAGLRRKLVKQ